MMILVQARCHQRPTLRFQLILLSPMKLFTTPG
jgi:hypothetical protein